MAIGRRFEETFQKAIRMINPSLSGFEPLAKMEALEGKALEYQLKNPDHERVFAVAAAFRATAARTRAPDPHAPAGAEDACRPAPPRRVLAPRRPPRSPTSRPRRATRSG